MTSETRVTHTPGQWEASKGEGLAHWNISGDGQCLANVFDFIGSPTLYDRVGQGEANAHLIASAPDLLAALERAHESIRLSGTPYVHSDNKMCGCFMVEAIRRARGED